MKERPILFSAPMVHALLDGRKTMTRRIAIPRHDDRKPCEHWTGVYSNGRATMNRHCEHGSEGRGCPHGDLGDRLWVREAIDRDGAQRDGDDSANYVADGAKTPLDHWPWKRGRLPGMFMPRGLSRITLEIVSVRVERVQDISEADAIKEGITGAIDTTGMSKLTIGKDEFSVLWDSINAKRGYGWAVNPWVWVISFKRIGGAP